MCNNLAVVSKNGDFDTLISRFKLGLVFGRKNGNRGTGFVHNGRRRRSRDQEWINGISYTANHDSLDFLKTAFFLKPKGNYNIMMGHNRAPSSGMGYGAKFTHPFQFGKEVEVENKHGEKETVLTERMWFQHNGTITNINELCEHFGYKYSDFGNDSYAMGQMIYDGVDPEAIFKMYEGAATCIWYFEKKGRLNIWKGASLNTAGDQVVDRHLYMLKVEDQIWFNTDKSILKIMFDFKHSEKIETVPHNSIITVYKNLTLKEKKVDREVYAPYAKPKARVSGFIPAKTTLKKAGGLGSKKDGAFEASSFRDNRYAFNQVIWFCGFYYINNVLAFGVHRINDEGRLSPDGKEYAFWKGKLLKDVKYYADAFRNDHVRTDYLHPRALHHYKKRNKPSLRWRFNNRRMVNHSVKNILFHSYGIKFHNGKMVKGGIRDESTYHKFYTSQRPPSMFPVEWVKNFNTRFGTDYVSINSCKAHYLKHVINDELRIMSVHHRAWRDFSNICEGNDFLFDTPICEIYNDVMGTKFFTDWQCLNDFANRNDYKNINNTLVKDFCSSLSGLFDGDSLTSIKKQLQLV